MGELRIVASTLPVTGDAWDVDMVIRYETHRGHTHTYQNFESVEDLRRDIYDVHL